MSDATGVSRRDFLKRGAALGGAIAWATPVVQTIGMRAAFAQTASPACTVWYAAKIQRIGDTATGECVDISGQTNPNDQQCLDADDIGVPVVAGACASGHIQSWSIPEQGADDKTWTVRLDDQCQFVDGTGRCLVKVGNACYSEVESGPNEGDHVCQWDAATRTLTFLSPDGRDISHVEFAFCCSD
jgi:hypothetical protein